MKEPKDKRTKAWKEWDQWKQNFDKKNSIGLGDVVEKVTKATGIKKMVETFTDGKDCGCQKRKEKLNHINIKFPVVRCFTEEQWHQWSIFRKKENKNQVTRHEQIGLIIPIYRQLFARQLKVMNCCIEPFIKQINNVYESYL